MEGLTNTHVRPALLRACQNRGEATVFREIEFVFLMGIAFSSGNKS